MAFPGTAFFITLALLQFFVIADNLVTWLHLDSMTAVNIAAVLSGLVLFIGFLFRRRESDPDAY